MTLADYIYSGNANWQCLIGFVGRIALHSDANNVDNRRFYQKLLIITWMYAFLILGYAYAGTLTALLAIPSFEKPIHDVEGLVNQDEFSWILVSGSSMVEYLKGKEWIKTSFKKSKHVKS